MDVINNLKGYLRPIHILSLVFPALRINEFMKQIFLKQIETFYMRRIPIIHLIYSYVWKKLFIFKSLLFLNFSRNFNNPSSGLFRTKNIV